MIIERLVHVFQGIKMPKLLSYLTRFLVAGGLVLGLSLPLASSVYAQNQGSTAQDPENAQYEKELQEARRQILSLFGKKVKADGLYNKLNGCYTIEIEDIYEGVAQIAVKEKVTDGCVANSENPVVLDRFVANPVGDDYEWYWLKDDGESEPYENAKKKAR